jgi:hypothetical protein
MAKKIPTPIQKKLPIASDPIRLSITLDEVLTLWNVVTEMLQKIPSRHRRLCQNMKIRLFGKGERRSGGKDLDLPARSRFGEGRAATFDRLDSALPTL